MRFRSKFAWLQLAQAVLWAGLGFAWFVKHSHAAIGQAYFGLGILQTALAIYCLASYFFTWWEIDEAGLIQHRLWSARTILWNEITRVGPWQPGKKPRYKWAVDKTRYSYRFLAVDYMGPASDHGELVIQPADRDALVRALRTHAPQAEFDFLPVEI
jgi:hypothetical protein